MAFEADLLIDRQRLKRSLFVWRLIAVASIVAVLAVAFGPAGGARGPHVARLVVGGIISQDRKRTEAVEAAAADKSVAALMLVVDSPGGSVAGGESLHAAVAHVAAVKPVVVVMEGTAASAAYMISVPAARIFARDATLTGSIGVLLQTGEASGLLRSIGVSADAITSGPLKDQPSFTRPLTDPGRAYLHDLVMDMYDQFVTMVADGRHMDKIRVQALADGRAYTGRQALALGLVDQIGGETEARAWLAEARAVPANLPTADLLRPRSLVDRTIGDAVGNMLGDSLSAALHAGWKSVVSQGVTLDEPLALWQPGRQ